MTERRTRKKTKTPRSRAVSLVGIDEDTGLERIKRERGGRSGPIPCNSEIRAVSARLRTLLRSKELKDPEQEAGVIEEARRLAAELDDMLERQQPPDPLLELAVDGALDAIELRSLLTHHAELQKQVRAAKSAYKKSHEPRDVVRALKIPTPKGRPTIDHHRALRQYLVLLRRYRRQSPVDSLKGEDKKSRALLQVRLRALAEVRKKFGYETDKAALAGLQLAKRTANTTVKKSQDIGKSLPRDVRAAANALLPSRTEARGKTDPSQ